MSDKQFAVLVNKELEFIELQKLAFGAGHIWCSHKEKVITNFIDIKELVSFPFWVCFNFSDSCSGYSGFWICSFEDTHRLSGDYEESQNKVKKYSFSHDLDIIKVLFPKSPLVEGKIGGWLNVREVPYERLCISFTNDSACLSIQGCIELRDILNQFIEKY